MSSLIYGITKIVSERERQQSVDAAGGPLVVLQRFIEAYDELRRSAPKGDLKIHLYVEVEKEDMVTIVINGEPVRVAPRRFSYDEIVALAGLTGTPSMTVHFPPRVRAFVAGGWNLTLSPGQSIQAEEGTIINVVHTGNA